MAEFTEEQITVLGALVSDLRREWRAEIERAIGVIDVKAAEMRSEVYRELDTTLDEAAIASRQELKAEIGKVLELQAKLTGDIRRELRALKSQGEPVRLTLVPPVRLVESGDPEAAA